MNLFPLSQLRVFLLLSPLALAGGVWTLVILGKRLGWKSAWALMTLLTFASGILATNLFELSQHTSQGIEFWSGVTYLFVSLCPVAWFFFALTYVRGMGGKQTPSVVLFVSLCLVPAVTSVLKWTNAAHHLVWVASELRTVDGFTLNVVLQYGPWFWVHFAYSYGLYLVGCTLLLADPFLKHRLYKIQSLLAVAGGVLPLVFNTLYVLRVFPGTPKDFTPLAVSFSGLLFAWGVVRFGLIQLRPGEMERLHESFPWGIAVLNQQGKILDINAEACRLLALVPSRAVGTAWPFPMSAETGEATRDGVRLEWKPYPDSDGTPRCLVYLREGDQPLSRREKDLAALAAQGLSNKEIARRLNIAESTVKTHIHHILKKTNRKSRTDLP